MKTEQTTIPDIITANAEAKEIGALQEILILREKHWASIQEAALNGQGKEKARFVIQEPKKADVLGGLVEWHPLRFANTFGAGVLTAGMYAINRAGLEWMNYSEHLPYFTNAFLELFHDIGSAITACIGFFGTLLAAGYTVRGLYKDCGSQWQSDTSVFNDKGKGTRSIPNAWTLRLPLTVSAIAVSDQGATLAKIPADGVRGTMEVKEIPKSLAMIWKNQMVTQKNMNECEEMGDEGLINHAERFLGALELAWKLFFIKSAGTLESDLQSFDEGQQALEACYKDDTLEKAKIESYNTYAKPKLIERSLNLIRLKTYVHQRLKELSGNTVQLREALAKRGHFKKLETLQKDGMDLVSVDGGADNLDNEESILALRRGMAASMIVIDQTIASVSDSFAYTNDHFARIMEELTKIGKAGVAGVEEEARRSSGAVMAQAHRQRQQ